MPGRSFGIGSYVVPPLLQWLLHEWKDSLYAELEPSDNFLLVICIERVLVVTVMTQRS